MCDFLIYIWQYVKRNIRYMVVLFPIFLVACGGGGGDGVSSVDNRGTSISTGDSGTGDSDTGDSGKGDSDTGDSDTDDSDKGDSGTGDSDTGDSDTDDSDKGDSGSASGCGTKHVCDGVEWQPDDRFTKTQVCKTTQQCRQYILADLGEYGVNDYSGAKGHLFSLYSYTGDSRDRAYLINKNYDKLYANRWKDTSKYSGNDWSNGIDPDETIYDKVFDYKPVEQTKSATWRTQEIAVGLDKITQRGRGVSLGVLEDARMFARNKEYGSRVKLGMRYAKSGVDKAYLYDWYDKYNPFYRIKNKQGKRLTNREQTLDDNEQHVIMSIGLMAGTEYGIAKKSYITPYSGRWRKLDKVQQHALKNKLTAINVSMGNKEYKGNVQYFHNKAEYETFSWGKTFIDNLIKYSNDNTDAPVWVWAAGNHGDNEATSQANLPLAVPEAEKFWLTVVDIAAFNSNQGEPDDPDNDKYTIDGKEYRAYIVMRTSNYCGRAKRWCVAAIGTYGKYSLNDDWEGKSYTEDTSVGTSAAAPSVTGGMAVIKEKFPSKSNAWVRNRLLYTARHETADGKKLVYFERKDGKDATNGAVKLATPTVGDDCISKTGCSEQFGNGIMRLDLAVEPISAVSLAAPNSYRLSASKLSLATKSSVASAPAFGDGMKVGFAGVNTKVFDSMYGEFDKPVSDFVRVQMKPSHDKAYFTPVSLTQKINPMFSRQLGMKLYNNSQLNTHMGLLGNTNMIPFTQAKSVVLSYGLNNTSTLNMAFSPSKTDKTAIGKVNMQYMTVLSNEFDKKSAIAYGVNSEKGSIYGTQMRGQFKQNGHTNTAYISYHMQKNINNWHMRVNSTVGLSTISGLNGVMHRLDNVSVSEWGVQFRKTLSEKSVFGFGLRQPLKIETGDATVRYVDTVYDTDKLLHKDKTVSVAPSGRAVILEVMYRKDNTSVRMYYKNDANHTATRKNHGIFVYRHIPFITKHRF